MSNEDLNVRTAGCGHEEYSGLIYWLNGERYCRACIYKLWTKNNHWKQKPDDYVFPLYVDGINYSDKVNLCDTCVYEFPACDGEIKFGNGIGDDNVIGCSSYIEE